MTEGDDEEPSWTRLRLPAGFGEQELHRGTPEPKEEAPTNMAALLPLASPPQPTTQREFWLAVVKGGRLLITGAWRRLGEPPWLTVGVAPAGRAVTLTPAATGAAGGEQCRRVFAERGSVRFSLPPEALDRLELPEGGGAVLLTIDAGTVLLANPEWLPDLAPRGKDIR
jgi:hypothetical protein